MTRLQDLSIKWKLTVLLLGSTLTVLLLACITLVAREVSAFRHGMVQEMSVLADVVGDNSRGALSFESSDDAEKTLASLNVEPHVIGACLYDKKGARFAEYTRKEATVSFPASPPADGYYFERDDLLLAHPIVNHEEHDQRVGTIYIVADLQQINDQLKSYAIIICLVVVAAFLVTFTLSFRLHRFISDPILKLAETARIVAEKKDYSVRAPTKGGKDEISLLTSAVNHMLSEIEAGHRAMQQANQSLETQAQEITQAKQSLEGQTGRIMETVSVLGSSSKEILSSSSRLAASAIETATAVNQTTTTVEEVRQTSLHSSQKTRQVSESAQRAAEVSERGKQSTEETAEGMHRIREQMQSISASMMRLSEQTQTIGGIINTVEDLAQQSNLLSVNAAIEAAKAGEHGKGFGVVAQEVKYLADQSRQATTQVRTVLNDIQRATNAVVLAIEQGSKAVESGVDQSAEAGRSIILLAANVSEAALASAQIAASSQQQVVGMDQVAHAMESIKQASTQNVESAKQLETAAKGLSELGRQLEDLVGRYKVSSKRADTGRQS